MELTSTQDKKPIKLVTYRYPAENAKGVIVFFHTMGFCMGVYGNMAKHLASNGYTFVGFDQRGHGKSEGERGYLDDMALVTKDARTFIEGIFKMYPGLPVFIMGHGAGGLLALTLYREFKDLKFAGLILGSVALKKPAHSKVLSTLSDFALKIMPNKTGIFALKYEDVTSNPNASEYLHKNPETYHDKVFVGSLMQLMTLMEKNEESKWNKIETGPIVIIQGEYDKVADPINSINFYESIKTKDKEYWWYPKMWNLFPFEPQAN